MARILCIYKQFPAPAVGHAGGESLYHLLAALHRRGHEISVVARIQESERAHLGALEAICTQVTTVPHHRGLPGPRWLAFARSYVALRRAARRALRTQQPDLVHVETTQTAVAVLGLRRPPTSYRTQDLNWLLLEQRAAQQTGLRQRLTRWSARLARHCEGWLCRRQQLVLAISEGDRRLLAPLCGQRPLLLLPLAPACHPDPHREPAVPPGPNVLFVGAMARSYNVEGVAWFLDEVWPLINAQHPTACCYIVGSHPPEALRAREDGQRIFVTGFVKDLAAWYQAAAVFISPLRVAGGLLQKVIDALAMGVPVVATSVSNHGVGATDGEHLCIADSAMDFAAAVNALLADPALREQLGAAGRLFIQEHYDSEAALARWEQALEGLLARK